MKREADGMTSELTQARKDQIAAWADHDDCNASWARAATEMLQHIARLEAERDACAWLLRTQHRVAFEGQGWVCRDMHGNMRGQGNTMMTAIQDALRCAAS